MKDNNIHPMLNFELEDLGPKQAHQIDATLVYMSDVPTRFKHIPFKDLEGHHFHVYNSKTAYTMELLVLVHENYYRILADREGLGVEVMSLNFPNLEQYEQRT